MKFLKILSLSSLFLWATSISAQEGIYGDYAEPADTATVERKGWENLPNKLQMSWGSRDIHYEKYQPPLFSVKTDTVVYAWRGERIGVQAVLFSREEVGPLSLRISGNKSLGGAARFVNYVWTDNFRGCGNHPTGWNPYLVPDVIDRETTKMIERETTRPIWCTLEIPQAAKPGAYSIRLEVLNLQKKVVGHLNLEVVVQERMLPKPSDWKFNLNFWMQPYAVSRYYRVSPWSQAHFDALLPYMQMLAKAGQKVGTAILFYEPWGAQSNDKFEPMVSTTKKVDGSWAYDYTIFDRWITFLDSCGINGQINCFSMVPWDMSFRYMDEASQKYAYLKTSTSSTEYEELWTDFLRSFAKHLKAKGWFERTVIAMDERGLDAMTDAYRVAQQAVPGIKMALAGNYHKELADKLYDYCVAYGQHFTDAELSMRNAKGWVTTTYTACPDSEPNVCSNNSPADAAYLPIYCLANGFNGFLRWAWMNWTDAPLQDTRFRMFTPGDTYMVYPGGRSSIRFERVIEGVQQAEKVRLLREECARTGNTAALQRLNELVSTFASGKMTVERPSSFYVDRLENLLNDPSQRAFDKKH